MATNDFLPFATGAGSNVISQASYAALAAQQTGFQAGVANSAQLNKVWRQSSIMAAVLAQFSVDLTGQNAVDDGTLATLLANLKSAIRLQGTPYAGAAGGTGNALTATLSPAPAAYTDGMIVIVRVALANTGAVTLNVNGLGSQSVVGVAHQNLQGGELVPNGFACFVYSTVLGCFLLVWSTGGAEQVGTGTQSNHAVTLAQLKGLGLNAVLNTINANTTLTAANMGQSIPIFGAGGITLTLPAVSATAGGQRLEFFNYSSGTVTVACAGADVFVPNGSVNPTSLILGSGDTLVLESLGASGVWYAVGGSVQLPYSKAFTTATSGVVGAVRNLKMSVTAASASATLTADEIIVEASLGGIRYCLANFSKTINLATTGAGGMDTGSAPTSGFVALYAIYNPTTGASALLGVNATSAAAPNVYGGANMPAGYTASALVSVWPTNGSGQFGVGYQSDRRVSFPLITALSSSVVQGSFTSISIASAVPLNAKSCTGEFSLASTSTSNMGISVAATASTIAQQNLTVNGNVGVASNFKMENIVTPQTLYYSTSNSAGTPTFAIYISSYEF